MAKAKSFADKVAKSTKDLSKHCPKCKEPITAIQLVASERSPKSGAWRFNSKFMGLCKCNEKEVIK